MNDPCLRAEDEFSSCHKRCGSSQQSVCCFEYLARGRGLRCKCCWTRPLPAVSCFFHAPGPLIKLLIKANLTDSEHQRVGGQRARAVLKDSYSATKKPEAPPRLVHVSHIDNMRRKRYTSTCNSCNRTALNVHTVTGAMQKNEQNTATFSFAVGFFFLWRLK